MEDHILDAPADVKTTLKYAGFWIRVAATVIDSIILYIAFFAMAFLFMDGLTSLGTSVALQLVFAAIGIAYFAGMESSSRQATLGKMAVGIKVGNANGGQISFGNAVGRYFSKIVSAAILYIGFMMAGWDSKKQALHDKIAGTYVFYA